MPPQDPFRIPKDVQENAKTLPTLSKMQNNKKRIRRRQAKVVFGTTRRESEEDIVSTGSAVFDPETSSASERFPSSASLE